MAGAALLHEREVEEVAIVGDVDGRLGLQEGGEIWGKQEV